LRKLAEFLVAEGVVDDHLPRGPAGPAPPAGRVLSRLKTWKRSRDPALEAKKNRILALYGLMDGTADELAGDPEVVMCVDEFGPLNLQPHPGRHWTTRAGGGPSPRRRRRATSTRPHGVRHLGAADDLSRDKLYGNIKPGKRRGEFLAFLRYLRTLYPLTVRVGIVLDNLSPTCRPPTTPASATGQRPTTSSWPMCPPTLPG
jgi:hypothetical protein